MRRILLLLAAILAAAAVAAALLTRPLQPAGLAADPSPAMDYEEALRRVADMRGEDAQAIAPDCRTLLLDHGARTPRVVVLLHGLTNCPAQFDSLARMIYARGDNVFVPRLPEHGMADRMTDALARVDAAGLRAFTDRVLDTAAGLGDTLIVAGLSVGGTMTAWAAQERPEVDRAVVIAPVLGFARAPGPRLGAALTRLALTLPNAFAWWDDRRKQDLPGPAHVYPRFATRAIAATMLLGAAATADAERRPPACPSLVLITVGGDRAIDNDAVDRLARSWRAHGAPDVRTYRFPEALQLNHDIVDPEQVGGNPTVTYPVLLEAIAP